MPRDTSESLGQVFSQKEIKLLKQVNGALSKHDLIQKLEDPPRKFKPHTNMNKTGKMTTLKLTYTGF